jgi:hypothetical protein
MPRRAIRNKKSLRGVDATTAAATAAATAGGVPRKSRSKVGDGRSV